MEEKVSPAPVADVGIVGGGQLARMTVERATRLGLSSVVLDPVADCPAAAVGARVVRAAFDDAEALRRLVRRARVTTFDIETVDTRPLLQLEAEGYRIEPHPTVIATIQDKLRQRRFLASHGLPVPRFADLPKPSKDAIASFGYPCVQKARRGGYDGRGVAILRSEGDLVGCLRTPSLLEELVDIRRELAVLVARGRDGRLATYDPVELFPDPATHVLDVAVFPASVAPELAARVRELAEHAVAALHGVGVFAVELFVDGAGAVWINEISPRPHNSGHVTIEAAATCQFEQHVRAIMDLPLGDTRPVRAAAMANLLGDPGADGPARLEGLDDVLAVPGVRVHLYGKSTVRPGRKMGHLTALDDDADRAAERVREARSRLSFVAVDGEAAA